MLQLSSNKNSDLSKRRVVPGVRLDDETPEGGCCPASQQE